MFVERRSKEAKFVFERNKMDQQDEVSKISKKEKDLILLSFALFLLFIVSATID